VSGKAGETEAGNSCFPENLNRCKPFLGAAKLCQQSGQPSSIRRT
jgi:hypothetical protein